jgi:hypothetical protein
LEDACVGWVQSCRIAGVRSAGESEKKIDRKTEKGLHLKIAQECAHPTYFDENYYDLVLAIFLLAIVLAHDQTQTSYLLPDSQLKVLFLAFILVTYF